MGTVSFEVPGPGTYQVTCDPKLDTLANSGTAGDVLAGKQFYNDQNAPVTGTMPNNPPQQVSVAGGESYTIPQGYHDGTGKVTGTGTVLPTLADPAGAGDILAGKEAVDQSGALLTGTMPDHGAVDVDLAAGGTYTVPAGYHNGAGKVKSTAAPLPVLTNPGTAGDLRKDKQLISQSGNVVTGTLEPVDTSDATAAAGDILAPKTAYVAGGKVTGTIATRGDSDVTASGPTVAVPAGYYPQGVNKTVSDPDLIPGNIKSGVDILGVTGSLSPEYAGVLVVTVDAGAVVTATDGATTLIETSTGTATFYLPNGGTWTVSAALNGSQATPATVEVQENFSVALSAGASQTVNVPTQYEAELSFSPIYTVTLTIDPAGSGTVTGAGEYQEGAQATVTAEPGDGYKFAAWKESGGSRLPNGYTELEYIQSSGTQYIDLGEYPANGRIVVDFEPVGSVSSNIMFGASQATDAGGNLNSWYSCRFISDGLYFLYYSNTGVRLLTYQANYGRLTIDVDSVLNTITLNNGEPTTVTPVERYKVPLKHFLIFGWAVVDYSGNLTSVSSQIPAKLYSCKIYTDSTHLTHDFVPCVNQSSEVGLYDLVNGSFYANAGTGAFTAGPEIGGDVTVSEDPEYTFTVSGDRTLAAVFAEKSEGLPNGYTQTEYVTFPKAGYLYYPTGFYFNFATSKIVLDVQGFRGTTSENSTMIAAGSKTKLNLSAYIVYSYNRYYFEAGSTRTGTNLNAGGRYTIIFDGPTKKVTFRNNQEYDFSFSAGTGTSTEIMFGSKTGNCSYMNVYSMQAYDNDILARNYIPCTNPDGVAGLYDTVTKSFLGSGALTPGPGV